MTDRPHNSGERHHNARLTDDQVRKIRRMYARGMTNRQITDVVKVVSYWTIHNITSGRSWRKVV